MGGTWVRGVPAGLLDLVVPVHCVGCAAPGVALCAGCAGGGGARERYVRGVGPVFAAAEYDGALRAGLLRYKERGRRELLGPLADVLADVLAGVVVGRAWPAATLVPVVSARAAARTRGGDHVVRLARATGRRSGMAVCRALRPAGAASESVGLGAAERHRAVRGTLAARRAPPVPGAAAVVVDDVVTTGATLAEAARVLRSAGWRVPGAVVLMSVPAPAS